MRYFWLSAAVALFLALLITDRHHLSPTSQSTPHRSDHSHLPTNDDSSSTFIIRFKQYQMAHIHHASLQSALPKDSSWNWIDRNNPASHFPTDFALITSSTHSRHQLTSLLQDQLPQTLFKDVHQEKVLSMRDLLGKEHSSTGEHSAFTPCDENDDGSSPCIKKRSGRINTRPTIGLNNDDDYSIDEQQQKYNSTSSSSRKRSLLEILHNLSPASLPAKLGADKLWDLGFSGQGIKMGVFDTGIKADHPHIRNITERTNWTHEPTLDDGLGHGSFVAGVIGGSDASCPGLAPSVSIHTFRVFTNDQVSYTSWFLDAFNYAMASRVDIVNLSIGGPDYLDAPFVDKVMEVTSSGIVMVSAIGNDGPLYGTLNNPADQNDVIGVGGIDFKDNIASFSSRGMSTWELPLGHGRSKPDVMAYGREVSGSRITGGCRKLSGTSVASPVVAGAVCLLASVIPEEDRWRVLNPAVMKQALVEGAQRLPVLNLYEQGQGKLNVVQSMEILSKYTQPRASVVPAALNLADCPYMWPYCRQPLYANAMPIVFNTTVLNGMGLTGEFSGKPTFTPTNPGGQLLDVQFEYPDVLWPWSGYLALYIRVKPEGVSFNGTASGVVKFEITSPPPARKVGHPIPSSMYNDKQSSIVELPITAHIIPTPPREKRVLWDQLHSLRYPPAYIPRDNLAIRHDILDWHGDHPHTNYHMALNALLDAGFSVELLTSPATCFDGENYGVLLVVDPEDEWYKEEIVKVEVDVREKGMGLVVLAEWYDEETLYKLRFYDDNTRSWWEAATGGANVPALNDLLKPYGVALAGGTHDGSCTIEMKHRVQGDDNEEGEELLSVNVASGSSLAVWPAGGYVYRLNAVGGRRRVAKGLLQDNDGESILDNDNNGEENAEEQIGEQEEEEEEEAEEEHDNAQEEEEEEEGTMEQPEDGTDNDSTMNDDDMSSSNKSSDLPPAVLGVLQHGAGRLAVFGDSNCIDASHQKHGNCYDLLLQLVQYASGVKSSGLISSQYLLTEPLGDVELLTNDEDDNTDKLPRRRPDIDLSDISFVLQHPLRCYPNAPSKYTGMLTPDDFAQWRHVGGGETGRGVVPPPPVVSLTNITRGISEDKEKKRATIDSHRQDSIDDELSEHGDNDGNNNNDDDGGGDVQRKQEIAISIPSKKEQQQIVFNGSGDGTASAFGSSNSSSSSSSSTSSTQIARASLGMMVVGAVLLGALALKGRRQLAGWRNNRLILPLWRMIGRQTSFPRGRDE